MDIPGEEDNLVLYIVDTFERKLSHYEDLLTRFYAQGKYPEKDVVTGARDLMKNILSQQKDNVALLNRMLQKQDDLLILWRIAKTLSSSLSPSIPSTMKPVIRWTLSSRSRIISPQI